MSSSNPTPIGELDDWRLKFTEEQLAAIKKCWKGEPPDECTGRCKFWENMFMMGCEGCSWDDGYRGGGGDAYKSHL